MVAHQSQMQIKRARFSLMSTHFKGEKWTKGHDKDCKTQSEQDDE